MSAIRLLVLAVGVCIECATAQIPEGHVLFGVYDPLVLNPQNGEVTELDPIVLPSGASLAGFIRQDPNAPDTIIVRAGLPQSANPRIVFAATRYDGRRRVSWRTYDPLASFGTQVGVIDYRFWRTTDLVLNLYFPIATGLNGIYAIQPWPNGPINLITRGPMPGAYWEPRMSIAGDTAILGEGTQVSFLDLSTGTTFAGPSIQSIEPRSTKIDQLLAIDRDQAVVLDESGFILLVNRTGGQVLGWMWGAPSGTPYHFGGPPVFHPTQGLQIPWSKWMYRVGTPATRIYEAHPLPSTIAIWHPQLSTFRGASIFQYGEGCRTLGRSPPQITASGVPSIGNASFTVHVIRGAPSTVAWLLLGADRNSLGGTVPLPLDLTPFGLKGCSLLTDVLLVAGTATQATGIASVPLPIPNNATFSGIRLTCQWTMLDPSGSSLPLWFSEGCELHVR